MRWLAAIGVLMALLLAVTPGGARAHALDPGYLSLENVTGQSWRVFWRKPDVSGRPMEVDAQLPAFCTPASGPTPYTDGKAWVSQWQANCSETLQGATILIDGLENTQTDVLLRLQNADGTVITSRLTADVPAFEVPVQLSGLAVFWQYLVLGWEHILEGLDHLLFVFALLVLVQSPGRLLGAITAFTVAHSITLAAASLGLLSVPSPPVEAAIALSIVLLAVEILKQGDGKPYLTANAPWIVAFLFGLLHGLGFAGALSEIGLPSGDIPLALLAFNLGVEAGQLTFVAGVLAVFVVLRRMVPALARTLHAPGAPGTKLLGYAIGGVSVIWLTERVAGF
ncbi:HupE/UreJ family protein [Fluviibacterium sp. DFM31]|uniref:HupE/UreJ family protein n=1 Tax=Meridianimarinicoccus marinus TaxID=3231483 RepID=A0ABV3L4K4_9RHOB